MPKICYKNRISLENGTSACFIDHNMGDQVVKSPENGTKTSRRYQIDHNRDLKGMRDCLMAVQVP